MLKGILGWSLLLGLLAGCGSDDGQSKPVTQCQAFADTWCSHAVGCMVEVGRLPASEQSSQTGVCKDVAVAAAQCSKAVSVGSGYDTCISQIKAIPCSTYDVDPSQASSIALPASCTGVIQISQ